MKRLAPLVIVAALTGLIGPSAASWIRTRDAIATDHALIHDDGRRYLLGAGSPREVNSVPDGQRGEVLVQAIGEMLRGGCEDRADVAECLATSIDAALPTAGSGLDGAVEVLRPSTLDELVTGQLAVTLVLVRSANGLLPLVLHSHDELFVSGYVPGGGRVLYRRRYFEQDWVNIAVVVRSGLDGVGGEQ